jgi:hypothetical protein
MKILENNALDASAKAKQLQQRFEQLPQDWQDNLKIYLSSMIYIH